MQTSVTRVAGIGAVMALLTLLSLITLDWGPFIIHTYPTHTTVLALALYPNWYWAALLVPLLFAAWSYPLVRGDINIPSRSLWLGLIVIVGNIANFAFAWYDGLRYDSTSHFRDMILLNTAFFLGVTLLAILGRKRPSPLVNWTFHIALFAWLAFAAFPYFGELP